MILSGRPGSPPPDPTSTRVCAFPRCPSSTSESSTSAWGSSDTRPGQAAIIRASSDNLESFTEMPIYEYRCESCAEKFELLTRFAERDTAQVCPACESTKTRVLVSSFAFASGGGGGAGSHFSGETRRGGGCGRGGGGRAPRHAHRRDTGVFLSVAAAT